VGTDVHGERRYRSPLRQERAADTRRRIATAALDLFAEHGFSGTAVTAIAERAGVSAQTVYATFGSKGALLRALLDQMEENADAALWRERIAADPDPVGKLTAFAQWSAGLFASIKPILIAAQSAASDPAVLDMRAEADGHRRAALDALMGTLEASGALRAGLSHRRAVDRAWILTGVEPYFGATEGCGWSDTAYATWLADLLVSQLLAPGYDSAEPRSRGGHSPAARSSARDTPSSDTDIRPGSG
jgi:AcrR family transcriptional regulator